MCFAIGELLADKLTVVKAGQLANIQSLSGYVQGVANDYFDPRTAPASVVTVLNTLANKAYVELELMMPFARYDESIVAFTDEVEEQIESVIDQFWAWSDRSIVTVKEAAELYGKSASTIYRWIKQGKLQAKKVKGRWQIIA